MDFTDERIDVFVNAWQKEFGERLTPDEARIEASNLLELAWHLMRPLPGEKGFTEGTSDIN